MGVAGECSASSARLSDYIMGGPIGYSSTDTGTRQPVVVLLKPSGDGQLHCRVRGKPVDIRTLQDRMRQIMAAQGENITAEELEVEIAVPSGEGRLRPLPKARPLVERVVGLQRVCAAQLKSQECTPCSSIFPESRTTRRAARK